MDVNNCKSNFKEDVQKFFLDEDANNLDKHSDAIINQIDSSNNDKSKTNENSDDIAEAFLGLKRLRKRAQIIKEEQEAKKIAASLFENEAELGSDNEEHDDLVKQINKNEERDEDNSELDNDLKDLINDEALQDHEYNEDDLQDKFFEDMLKKDREDIKRVIKGPNEQKKKLMRKELFDSSDLPLSERIKKFKSENEGNSDFFFSDLLFKSKTSNSSFKEENEYQHNTGATNLVGHDADDELKTMLEQHQNNRVKKFSDESKLYKKILISRRQENEKILENVIDLNGSINKINNPSIIGMNINNSVVNNIPGNISVNKNDTQNLFFQKGNIPSVNFNSSILKMQIAQKSNSLAHRFGSFYDSRNSFLHAMKNDKYYIKSETEELNEDDISKMKSNKDKILTGFSSAVGGLSKTQAKATNLSALFKSNGPNKAKSSENLFNISDKFSSSSEKSPAGNSLNMFKKFNN